MVTSRIRRIAASTRERVARVRTRHRWIEFPLVVQRRYGEVDASYVATAIGSIAFISLFPLLVVGTAVLGYLNFDEVNLVETVNDWLGISGEAGFVDDAISASQRNRRTATVVGLIGLLWSGLALVSALQHAYDRVWQVQDRGWRSRPFALVWLVGAALLLGVSIAANIVTRALPGPLVWLGLAVSLGTGFGLFLWSEMLLPNRPVALRSVLAGAAVGAVLLEILKTAGTLLLPWMASRTTALYGAIGAIFTVLLWLMLFARVLLYATVVNVVRWEDRFGTTTTTIEVPVFPGHEVVGIDRSGQAEIAAEPAGVEAPTPTAATREAPELRS